MNKRPLSNTEEQIIRKLLEPDFPGKDDLLIQLTGCLAESTNDPDNYGSIYLHPTNQHSANVTSRVPVEASTKDSDGCPVDLLLHVVNGLVNELEIIKGDGTDLLDEIKPDSLEVRVQEDGRGYQNKHQ